MRKFWSLAAVAVAVISLGTVSSAFSAPPSARSQQQNQFGTITGIAKDAKGAPLANYKVRVRDTATGQIVAEGVTSSTGAFNVTGLAPGTYVIELVGTSNKPEGVVVGLSSSVAVTGGSAASVTVTATAAGAVGAAEAGGFSLFGLGTAASIAVIGGAAAVGVAAAVALSNNASPSR